MPSHPSIDLKNPLYDPSISSSSYINSIRRRLQKPFRPVADLKRTDERLLRSFALALEWASRSDDPKSPPPISRNNTIPSTQSSWPSSRSSDIFTRSSNERRDHGHEGSFFYAPTRQRQPLPLTNIPKLKRKRNLDLSFTDFEGPPVKHARSLFYDSQDPGNESLRMPVNVKPLDFLHAHPTQLHYVQFPAQQPESPLPVFENRIRILEGSFLFCFSTRNLSSKYTL
jgi:hypothetical protein